MILGENTDIASDPALTGINGKASIDFRVGTSLGLYGTKDRNAVG